VFVEGDVRETLTGRGPYGVVVADPPWSYELALGEGTAEAEYALLGDDDLLQLEVPVADDAVLLMWTTWPKLDLGMAVLEAWGFAYVTGFPWVKTNGTLNLNYGVGYWFRGCSEPILVGRRGNVSPPTQEGFLGILSPNLHHSRKPYSIHEIGEALPGPRCEIFARRDTDGWDCFGNERDDQYHDLLTEVEPKKGRRR
jgi:N6-adenosine-specific RNA methylase IME4